jgi:hypothetical protein
VTEQSSLAELARFSGVSALTEKPNQPARRPLPTLTAHLGKNPQRRTVSELLGIVLTLSARTRRATQPRTRVDLDVFRPDGSRAVRIFFAQRP